jgi:hypothetical protein
MDEEMRYEIFDPNNGIPLYTVKYRWMAHLLCKLFSNHPSNPGGLDYALVGDGWV